MDLESKIPEVVRIAAFMNLMVKLRYDNGDRTMMPGGSAVLLPLVVRMESFQS